jgi:hypothetical protein
MIAKPKFWNGHGTLKAEGDTMWKEPPTQLPPAKPVTAEEAAEAMFDDGFVQFPDLLSPDEVKDVRAWMDRCAGPDEQYEVKHWCFNRHITGSLTRDPMWLTLMDRSPVYECLELVYGSNFRCGAGNQWTTGKGRAMGIHTDLQWTSLPEDVLMDPRVRIPIFSATLHYYLDDCVEEIGPTVLIPGSWRAGRYPVDEWTWRGRKPQMLSVKAGGAMLFRSDLWHGAMMNSSNRRRYMVQVFFSHGSLNHGPSLGRQEDFSAEVLAKLNPRTRMLLGGGAPKAAY